MSVCPLISGSDWTGGFFARGWADGGGGVEATGGRSARDVRRVRHHPLQLPLDLPLLRLRRLSPMLQATAAPKTTTTQKGTLTNYSVCGSKMP